MHDLLLNPFYAKVNLIEDEKMSQKIDKKKICYSIQKAIPKDMLFISFNPIEKNRKANVLKDIEKFIGNYCCEIVVVIKE